MKSFGSWFVLLALLFGLAGTTPRALAQSEKPADDGSKPASAAASKAEVDELRKELAAQRRTIEKLEILVEQLSDVKSRAPAEVPDAHLINANLPLSPNVPEGVAPAEEADAEVPAEPLEVQSPKKDTGSAPVTAGWNGEHFYIRSADGQFQIQPYGYVQTDYRSYTGDGAPADTFGVRRARFGFQGNYGDHYQFGLLIDAASTTGSVLRDVYLNAKYNNALQFQAGQFKEPFAQEEVTGITNIDFLERGLQAALYPSAASAFRSPGVTLHGDLNSGQFQYWAGAFNGKGYATNNTTSVPETVGRIRVYPWRNHKDSWLHDFAFGGSIAYSMSRGLSNEVSPSATINDGAYTWFPQFPVNGNIWRYEGEFTFIHGPLALRDEYVAASFNRTGVGTEQLGGLGFANLPNIRYQGWNSSITYLLTKELRPENGTPRVRHPVFGPVTEDGGSRGWGAWELAFRYSGIQGNEPGIFFNNVFTPQLVPTYNRHTDQFTVGVNWYLNYWVRFQSNVDINQLKDPSTIGAVPQNYLVFQQRLQFRF
jgi:phosphate-selective porin OprO and OprP